MIPEFGSSPILDELAHIAAAPPDAPMSPSGVHYTDPNHFEREKQQLLKRGWHSVGRSDEFSEIGSFQAFELLDESVLVVRTSDGFKAFANVCRHRGMPLVEGSGRARRFVCPYHAWTYGIDGRLVKAPLMEGHAAFNPKECKLGEFACVERFGFVYTSLSDEPVDFDANIEQLASLIGPYEPEKYRLQHTAVEHWNCNWKALVENFMEGYHLSVLHPITLHNYTPTRLSIKGPSGPGFTSYYANYPDDIPARGTGAPGLSPEERHRSTLFALYPTQIASISASLLVAFSIRPIAVDQIEVRWTLSTYGDDLDDDTIAQRIALWTEVNTEDRQLIERMQRGWRSRFAQSGPLSGPDHEGTVRDFINWQAQMHGTQMARNLMESTEIGGDGNGASSHPQV